MNHYIATAMATLILPLLCSIQTKAEQNPTPFKLPAAHIESFTAASGVSGDAINALQAFSPFATDEIEEPSFDSDLIGQMTDYAAKFLGTRYRRIRLLRFRGLRFQEIRHQPQPFVTQPVCRRRTCQP